MVTKSGTDALHGSARTYVTDDSLQSNNVTDALRQQGASTGNPIQNIKDYGLEAGGPIRKGRAWIWGSYGKQNINVGVNNFYKASGTCQAMKASPLTYTLPDVWGCLNADQTLLNNYNLKFALETVRNNQFSFYLNAAEKVRNARDASDLRPIETTYRQMSVDNAALGSSWWKSGIPKTYKWADRHIFSDRFLLDASYAHVGNNFALTFHDDALRSVQPSYEITTGLWGRSYTESIYVRPTDSIDVVGNYFAPGWLGGDHAFKFGFKYRNDIAHTDGHWGGNAIARFRNGLPAEANLYRDSATEYGLYNRNFYVQDSYTHKKLTVNLGLRVDFQTDFANPASVGANPFFGQATYAGDFNGVTYAGAPFNQLPALSFPGARGLGSADLWFKNVSPRVGLTYDLRGDSKNVFRFNYARYVEQLGGNSIRLSSTYNTVGTTLVRYPWMDVNGDGFVQANELVLTTVPLSWTSGYNYTNPSQTTTTGTNDPTMTPGTTDELLVGFDRQISPDFAVSAAYIWRKYRNFTWEDTADWTSANYTAVSYTPTGCPTGARCDTVTYYNPTSAIPVTYVYTNRPDYWRGYQGIELNARKRMTRDWMMNVGFSYNDAPVHYDSPAAYEDPTNIDKYNGGQYAPQSTTSGIENVYVNAQWIFRVSGSYTVPVSRIDVAGFYNTRSGYPFLQSVQSPSRPFGAGIASVLLDTLGDNRLPNYQQLDLRVARSFSVGQVKIVPAIDIFNLFDVNTALAERTTQNAANANTISAIVAPRVVRLGARVTW